MRKIYFLVTTLIVFLISNCTIINNSSNNNTDYDNDAGSLQVDKINLDTTKYLNLSLQDGKFYSWNQIDDTSQHVIGIYTQNNQQSYLLDNFGVFWTLDFHIFNFYRINNNTAIAQISYFQNDNKEEFFNQKFFVHLKKSTIIISDTPIMTENPYFTVLEQNNTKSIVAAYGVGLDLIDIETQKVKTIIQSDKINGPMTSFYFVSDNSGIFIGSDQYYYLLTNITDRLVQTKIKSLKAPLVNINNNVVVINETNVIIRDEENYLYFVDFSKDIIVNKWEHKSITKKIAFLLNKNTFILNISKNNSSSEYGIPYLVKTNNWKNLININNIVTIKDFMFFNETNGIFIDKNLTANIFNYQNKDDSFTITKFGNLHNFQFVNKTLFYATVQNHNLLVSQQTNKLWSVQKNVRFTSHGNANWLNTVIKTKAKDISYQNTYISDDYVDFSLNDSKVVEVVIKSNNETDVLKPKNNTITYTFSYFKDYHILIKLNDDNIPFILEYHVKIKKFSNQKLINISSSSTITSYVGYAKVALQNNLYDVKTINKDNTFKIDKYDYDYLQYVQVFVYDDCKNMVVKNVYNLIENSEFNRINDRYDSDFFFGIKVVNLLNQANWVYLGFSKNEQQPIINFWDTKFGENLLNKALSRRYLRADLKNMNSQEIKHLILISKNWEAIEIQGKSIVISVISIFFVALVGSMVSIGYNIFLNKKLQKYEKIK